MKHSLIQITDTTSLAHGLEQLRLADPQCIEAMIALAGPPPLRKREAGFDGLIRIIISQQVSTASAAAIYNRYSENFPGADPADLLAASDEALKSCGLSLPKMKTLRHLAEAIHSGNIDLAAMAEHDADRVRADLTAIKGIGPWTADVYLLFCLGHPDVWPAGDLALQEGVRLALNLRKRPDAAQLEKLSKRWKPWRAVAARLIWSYYSHRKSNRTANAKPPTGVKNKM